MPADAFCSSPVSAFPAELPGVGITQMSEITEHIPSPVNFPRAGSSAEPLGALGLAPSLWLVSGKNAVLVEAGGSCSVRLPPGSPATPRTVPCWQQGWHGAEYLGLSSCGLTAPVRPSLPTCWSSCYGLCGCFHLPRGAPGPDAVHITQRASPQHSRMPRKNLCSATQGDCVQPEGTRSCV